MKTKKDHIQSVGRLVVCATGELEGFKRISARFVRFGSVTHAGSALDVQKTFGEITSLVSRQ